MASLFRAAFPSGPLTDDNGNLSPAWRGFFQSLYARTGNANGVSSDTSALEAELEAERQARINADQALSDGLAAERVARQQADAYEARLRQNADAAETAARIAADALLVPIAQLCSMWAGCDLSFLPATDPGHGKPWLDGGRMTVGTATTIFIPLEDGTGNWTLEMAGTGNDWVWG